MLFSIIVPIYNVEEYLDKCVDSLRNQTYSDIEIILVDDGSPDRCPDLCDQYQKLDPRIKVIHKKNGGLSDARNAGLETATGDYVLFIDSDDFIEPDACEQFAAYAEKGYDMILADAIPEGGRANIEHMTQCDTPCSGKEYLLAALKCGKAPMAVWLNVYKKAFLDEFDLRFKINRLHEDEEFTPRAFLQAKSVIYTGIKYYHYYIREGSITTKKDKRKNAESLYATCAELQSVYEEISDTELRTYLLDTLTSKYLNMLLSGNIIQYGKPYYHKSFLLKNAKLPKTKVKALIFAISPALYRFLGELKNKQ